MFAQRVATRDAFHAQPCSPDRAKLTDGLNSIVRAGGIVSAVVERQNRGNQELVHPHKKYDNPRYHDTPLSRTIVFIAFSIPDLTPCSVSFSNEPGW